MNDNPAQSGDSPRSRLVMIIAGEVSGDMHAAALIREIQAREPGVKFFGIGGDGMKDLGVELFYHVKDMAVMGFIEVLRHFFFFSRVFKHMLALAAERKPDAIILVDYPGFNLRFAAKAHAMGLNIIYYICPQVWAWNQSRIPKMARTIDHLISIFPFEAEYFKGTGLKVDFVGHPLVDEALPSLTGPTPELPWHGGKPRVALLPGSRKHEIDMILPVMWATISKVEDVHPNAGFIIAAPSDEIADYIKNKLTKLKAGPERCEIVAGNTRHVLRQATAALVASGTATIEAALMQCPMAIIYKTSPLTYMIARKLIKVRWIGMVNIVADKLLCPEFIQEKAVPAAIAKAFNVLLSDKPDRGYMVMELEKISEALGPPGAAERAATAVLQDLGLME